MKGLFQLSDPRDLLAKLTHDLNRLRARPDDPYVAFDFFVTAEHMLDWLHPGRAGKPQREAERNANVILQIVSHLATGAKHMVPESRQHTSVEQAKVASLPYGAGTYGTGSFGGVTLIIQLDGAAAASLGHTIAPLALAEHVLAYWNEHHLLR